jgi:hypothetical protein
MKITPIEPRSRLTAYYDLKTAPITFDFVYFLASATAYCKLQGQSTFDLVIVADGWRKITEREKVYGFDERLWRLNNLIYQNVVINPYIANFTIQRTQLFDVAANKYPVRYSPLTEYVTPYNPRIVSDLALKGVDVQYAKPTAQARLYASRLLDRLNVKEASFVTLSPRIANFDRSRDSALEIWYSYYQYLQSKSITVIVVPDQDDLFGMQRIQSYDWVILPEVSLSLDLRLALYSLASDNIAASGGLSSILLFSKLPFEIVDIFHNSNNTANESYFEKIGLPIRGKWPWLKINQRFNWNSVTLESLTQISICSLSG